MSIKFTVRENLIKTRKQSKKNQPPHHSFVDYYNQTKFLLLTHHDHQQKGKVEASVLWAVESVVLSMCSQQVSVTQT